MKMEPGSSHWCLLIGQEAMETNQSTRISTETLESTFLLWVVKTLARGVQRGGEVSTLGDTQNPTGRNLLKVNLLDLGS